MQGSAVQCCIMGVAAIVIVLGIEIVIGMVCVRVLGIAIISHGHNISEGHDNGNNSSSCSSKSNSVNNDDGKW